MKGLILAAGRGTRLQPLTNSRSKPMVPLANRPLINFALDKLVEIGVTDVGIVVGENEDELRRDLAYPGAQLTLIRQPEPKGLAHAVSFARDFTADDDFILLFCDNLFSQDLHGSLDRWQALREGGSREVACMLHVHEVQDPRAFGVAVVQDGWVSELEEKPEHPRSNLAVVGIDFFTPVIYEAIGRIKPSRRGELEITDAIAELIAMGYSVRAEPLEGFWFDTGTFGDLLNAQSRVMELLELNIEMELEESEVEGSVGIQGPGLIKGSKLYGPSVIGRRCVIRNCTLGPNVAIADNCTLEDCELSNCEVYEGTTLKGQKASHAIFDGELRVDVDGQVEQPAKA
jgi:glucose-1-phosphate thymidylyltransferase